MDPAFAVSGLPASHGLLADLLTNASEHAGTEWVAMESDASRPLVSGISWYGVYAVDVVWWV